LLIEKGSPHCSPTKNPTETDDEDGRGLSSPESPQHIDSTLEDTPSLATGNIIHDPSNAQKSNILKNPRKAIPPQLPPVLVIEIGSPRCSSRKHTTETNNKKGRGLSILGSP
jgi:hypothetical protein